jgi:hypothetical protein
MLYGIENFNAIGKSRGKTVVQHSAVTQFGESRLLKAVG